MNINTLGKQQALADYIRQYKDALIIGALNDYEFAGRILAALEQMEADELQNQEDHDCKNDEFGTGHCEHPSHDIELVEHEAETESEAYRGAH